MIINFKIFENTETETTFILNDLLNYYSGSYTKIKKFLSNLLIVDTLVEFNCKNCYDKEKNIFIDVPQIVKGRINTITECTTGYQGTLQHKKRIFVLLSLILTTNDNYIYHVDNKSSFTIYGNITEKQKKVINEMNLTRISNKFNL